MAISPTTKTAQQVYNSVVRQFGDESGVQITQDDVLRWINSGCYDIVSRNNILKKTAKSSSVAGQAEYDFPTDLFRVEWVSYDEYPVERKTFAEVREQVTSRAPDPENAERPTFWYYWDDKLIFYPKPSTSIVDGITVYYSAAPTEVTSLSDVLPIPDRLYNRLIEYVLAQAHEMDEDWTAAAAKDAQFQNNMNAIKGEEEMQGVGFYPVVTVREEDL